LDALQKEKIEISPDYTAKYFVNGILNGKNNVSENIPSSSFGILKRFLYDNLDFLKLMLGNLGNFVELLYIIRPLLYLVLMSVFKKKSFVPFIFNVLIDAIILKIKRKEKLFDNQKTYFQEYKYRISRLSVYLLRAPIFSLITKPFIKKILKVFRVPTFLVDLVMSLLTYYSNIHFIL